MHGLGCLARYLRYALITSPGASDIRRRLRWGDRPKAHLRRALPLLGKGRTELVDRDPLGPFRLVGVVHIADEWQGAGAPDPRSSEGAVNIGPIFGHLPPSSISSRGLHCYCHHSQQTAISPLYDGGGRCGSTAAARAWCPPRSYSCSWSSCDGTAAIAWRSDAATPVPP
jgi:hypothetical protein